MMLSKLRHGSSTGPHRGTAFAILITGIVPHLTLGLEWYAMVLNEYTLELNESEIGIHFGLKYPIRGLLRTKRSTMLTFLIKVLLFY